MPTSAVSSVMMKEFLSSKTIGPPALLRIRPIEMPNVQHDRRIDVEVDVAHRDAGDARARCRGCASDGVATGAAALAVRQGPKCRSTAQRSDYEAHAEHSPVHSARRSSNCEAKRSSCVVKGHRGRGGTHLACSPADAPPLRQPRGSGD